MKGLFHVLVLLLLFAEAIQAQVKTIQGQLKPFEVVASMRPDTVISSEHWMIRDFEFQGENILVLTWNKNPNKCVLRKINTEHREIDSLPLTEIPYAFFRDVFDQVYLITQKHVYFIENNSLTLYKIKEDFFFGRIYPIAERVDSSLFFSTYNRKKPDFIYLNSKSDTLHEIRNKHLYDLYYSEYTFLPFHMKTEIKRRCSRSGESKYDVAAELTGFTNSLWWEDLYSPMFASSDTVFIADHYRDSLFLYDKSGKFLLAYPMNFHKEKGYEKEILRDYTSGEWFARYSINGRTHLKPVGRQAEITGESIKLHYRYIDKVKVHNGKAWYLYRPFESRQNSFLYAESIH